MKNEIIDFSSLYRTYNSDVYTFAYWLCKDENDAKDITSETFVRAWTAKANLNYSTVKAYLLKIARNIYLHSIRANRTFVEINETHKSVINTDLKLEVEELLSVIDTFEEPDKSIFMMKAYQGLSYKEISEIVDVSISACKVKVFRIRKKIIQNYNLEES